MEIIVGMILLLQALALIQFMRNNRKMLQQMELQVEKLKKLENMLGSRKCEDVIIKQKEAQVVTDEMVLNTKPKEMINTGNLQALSQEALINEVLSEVFS